MQLRPFGRLTDCQPHVPVDSRTFVKPPFFERRIHTHGHHVVATIVQVVGDIVACRRIAAALAAEPEAVDPDVRVAENAVETKPYPLPQRRCRHAEMLAVPAHAGFRPLPAHRLVAVAVRSLRGIRQVYHPVVRELHVLPGGIVKIHRIGSLVVDGSRLGEIIEILRTPSEVLFGRRSVSEGKLPAVVEKRLLRGKDRAGKEHQQQEQRASHRRNIN